MKYTRGNLDGAHWGPLQGSREELPHVLGCCPGTVCAQCLWWAAPLGAWVWLQNLLPPPRHGAPVDWARPKQSGDAWKSWETLMLCSTVLHTPLAFACVQAAKCDGSKLIFPCLLFRWTSVSTPWERGTYSLVDVCGTARHCLFSTPYLGVNSEMFASTEPI